jgi:hypothetical protein
MHCPVNGSCLLEKRHFVTGPTIIIFRGGLAAGVTTLLELVFGMAVIGAVAYAVYRDFVRVPTAAPVPESREGKLVAGLATATINREQYIRAMERLAARDDLGQPLAVPPETGPVA